MGQDPGTNALDIHELVMEVPDQALEFAEAAETIERLSRPLETLLTEECQEVIEGWTLPAGLTEDGLKQTVAETLATLHRTRQRCTDWAFADYLGIPRQTVENFLDEQQPGSIWVVHREAGFSIIGDWSKEPEGFQDRPLIANEHDLHELMKTEQKEQKKPKMIS